MAIEILLKNSAQKDAVKAFEMALLDVVKGRLPLGGATTKGHGFFSGNAFKNGNKLELADENK